VFRVLCVDDHRVMLDGLSLLISRQPDMESHRLGDARREAVDLFVVIVPTSR
jgi:chemotaxis response regulator CheB